ncbi:hypothetical protein [Virgisporangium aliadipatigenens]|nr:hypothetical protein [Virgisporangium aliadipatigenens]
MKRLARRGRDSMADLEALYATGYPRLENWDLEELSRGQPRDKNGTFTGTPPKHIRKYVLDEAIRRGADLTRHEIFGCVGSAVRVIRDLIESPDVDPKVRADLSKFVVEQIIGRAALTVQAPGIADKATTFLADRVVLDDGTDAHPVVTGEWSEGDDD